jgi:hypothetical protein
MVQADVAGVCVAVVIVAVAVSVAVEALYCAVYARVTKPAKGSGHELPSAQ